MANDSQPQQIPAPGPLATAGVPDEVFQEPAEGDLLPLITLRAHIHRCEECKTGGGCATRPILIKIHHDALEVMARVRREPSS